MARWGKGDGRRLFVLLGAAVAALFANDGAALILTPIVIAMFAALRFSPKATLAFVMAAGFIADTASLRLVVSNLVNIVSADYFDIGFARYAAVMVPVNLVSVAATLAALVWSFRKDIPASYDLAQPRRPEEAIYDRATFVAGWWVLAMLLVGALAIDATTTTGVVREAMVYANLIGADLGPKIAPIGSLATLLWLHVRDAKNIHIEA